MEARHVATGSPHPCLGVHERPHRNRRSLFAAFAVAAFVWLCLGDMAYGAAPANDDFANAAALSGLPANVAGTNVDATTESGEPEHTDPAWLGSVTPGGHSVWWSWTAPSDGDVTVDTCGSDFDTLLAVYTGDSVEALTPVDFNDTAFGGCNGTDHSGDSQLSFSARSGHVYRIAVDGVVPYWCAWSPCSPTEGRVGSIELALNESSQPANDDFANAAVITEEADESGHVSGTNAGASKQTGEPSHAGDVGGHSVWWSWTAPRSGLVRFDTCGSPAVDTLLAVYTGDAVDALTEVASNDDSPLNCGKASSLSFRPSAGQTYHIAVDGAAGSIGDFRLHKMPTPRNDDFENATPLSGLSATGSGINSGATSEPGEPKHAGHAAGPSLWWRWTAPANGSVEIDTCGSAYLDSVLAVYTGDAVDALSPVASNDDLASCVPGPGGSEGSGVAFTASAGTTYQIAVDGKGSNAIGIIVLSLRETPSSSPPPSSPPPSSPPPPSNDFSLGKLKRNEKKGTAKLRVRVPGSGELRLERTKRVRTDTDEVAGRKAWLKVRPRPEAGSKLADTGAVTVRLKVTYTPTGGEPSTESKNGKLKRS